MARPPANFNNNYHPQPDPRTRIAELAAERERLRELVQDLEHWLSTGGPVTSSDRYSVNALCSHARKALAEKGK